MKKKMSENLRVVGLTESGDYVIVHNNDYNELGQKMGIMCVLVDIDTPHISSLLDIESVVKFSPIRSFKKGDSEKAETFAWMIINQKISDKDIEDFIINPLIKNK